MIEPTLITQRAFDEARRGSSSRAVDLIEAIGRINEASLALSTAIAAELVREYACPEANPLNDAVLA